MFRDKGLSIPYSREMFRDKGSSIPYSREMFQFSQKFHNFGSTGPNCKIFTFLEMASKFIGTSNWAGGRGMNIEKFVKSQCSKLQNDKEKIFEWP